jgi:hypothetical protein
MRRRVPSLRISTIQPSTEDTMLNGPASADVLGFNGGYGSQVYAGAGYAILCIGTPKGRSVCPTSLPNAH